MFSLCDLILGYHAIIVTQALNIDYTHKKQQQQNKNKKEIPQIHEMEVTTIL